MFVMTELSSPISIELSLTHRCNHRCIHCFNPDRPLPIDDYSNSSAKIGMLMRELVENKVWKVIVSGGEPLTDPDLTLEILEELQSAGMDASLNTNLTLITSEFIEGLRALKRVPLLFVSLPSSDRDRCDEITGVPGSHDRILAGMELCRMNDIPIGLNIVYSKFHSLDPNSIIGLIERYPNICHVSISPVIPPEYDKRNEGFAIRNDDLIEIKDALLKINEETRVSVGSSTPLPLCIVGTELLAHDRLSMCAAGRAHCTVDFQTGGVFACSHCKTPYGSIYEEGLESCWKKMGSWRDNTLLRRECVECRYLALCTGECRILTMQGSRLELDPGVELALPEDEGVEYDEHTRFRVCDDLAMRDESFGSTLFVFNRYMCVRESTTELLRLLKGCDSFSIKDLKEIVNYDDNFETVLRYLIKNHVIIGIRRQCT